MRSLPASRVALPGPAQVAISPDGETLAVTEKATNVVDTFHVASTGQTPFGFSFNLAQPHELVVADAAGDAAGAAAVSAYSVSEHGAVAQSSAIADYQTAAC